MSSSPCATITPHEAGKRYAEFAALFDERLFLNLVADADESGIQGTAKSVVVAGWVSTKEKWAEFTLQWESVLCEYGVRNLPTHTLRCPPAMEAGLTDHIWSLEEIAALIP